MGLIFKARGNASIGLFLIRLTLGGMFLISGANKIVNIEGFIDHLKGLNVMPDNMAFIFGFILPFAEVFFGALFIIGLFTPITSFFMSVMIMGFIVTLGAGHEELAFSYHFVFLACTVTTLFSGAGLISFDALLDRKKKEEGYIVTRPVEPEKPGVMVKENVNIVNVRSEEIKEDTSYPNKEDIDSVKDTSYPHDDENK